MVKRSDISSKIRNCVFQENGLMLCCCFFDNFVAWETNIRV